MKQKVELSKEILRLHRCWLKTKDPDNWVAPFLTDLLEYLSNCRLLDFQENKRLLPDRVKVLQELAGGTFKSLQLSESRII